MNLNTTRYVLTLAAMIFLFAITGSIAIAEESGSGEGTQVQPSTGESTPSDTASTENEELIVKALDFQGNNLITDEQIIAVMVTRAGRPFSISDLEEDMRKIEAMGFFRTLPKYSAEPYEDGVKLTIFITENPKFNTVEVTVQGPGVISVDEIKSVFEYKQGEIISFLRINQYFGAIEKLYRDKGYSAATVVSGDFNDEGTVTISINEGVIKEIKVEGNTKTRSIVILRELTLKPGDVYDANIFRRNLENIFALQLFEDITVEYELSDEQELIVIIKVTEARTGQFGVGAGYSSQDGFLATFSYTERNFRGMGQRVNLLGQLGGPDPDFMLSYYSPVIDKNKTSMTTELLWISSTDRIRNLDDPDVFTRFTTKKKGGTLAFTRPLSETLDVQAKLSILQGSIDVKEGEITQDQFEEYARRGLIEGKSHSLLVGLAKDTRDFVLDPSTGYFTNVTATYYGGILGGDFDAIKGIFEFRNYINLNRKYERYVTGIDPSRLHESNVIAYRIYIGGADGDLSLFDSFKIGGSDSVRGAEEALQTGDKAILANLEYRFPIITNLSGAVFMDSGTAAPPGETLSLDNMVTSVGAGIRYRIPFFGIAPLRLDFGYDLDNKSSRIEFGFGQLF
jgi:outer membrane protein insertion porin family